MHEHMMSAKAANDDKFHGFMRFQSKSHTPIVLMLLLTPSFDRIPLAITSHHNNGHASRWDSVPARRLNAEPRNVACMNVGHEHRRQPQMNPIAA